LAAALHWLAEQLDHGRALDDALTNAPHLFPRYVRGLVTAAARTGNLGQTLAELVDYQRSAARVRQELLRGLGYSLVVTAIAACLLLFITFYVGIGWEQMIREFQVRLPLISELFLWWRHVGIWLLATCLGAVAVVLVCLRLRWSAAAWQRFLATVPLLGPLWHWAGLVEWCRLLQVLTRQQVPLWEALRLSADGLSNAEVGRQSLLLAEGVARGRSLSQLLAGQRVWPASLVPLVRWGEEAGMLADAFAAGGEMLAARVRLRSLFLRTLLPPLLFLAIGCGVLFVVGALFMPMINLLHGLS
jgi:type II secretory pathway component PulF